MLTTKNIKLDVNEPTKHKILTTTNTKPKEFPTPDPDAFKGVDRRETKKVAGDMLTTANYKDRIEASKPKPVKKTRKRKKK